MSCGCLCALWTTDAMLTSSLETHFVFLMSHCHKLGSPFEHIHREKHQSPYGAFLIGLVLMCIFTIGNILRMATLTK